MGAGHVHARWLYPEPDMSVNIFVSVLASAVDQTQTTLTDLRFEVAMYCERDNQQQGHGYLRYNFSRIRRWSSSISLATSEAAPQLYRYPAPAKP